MDKVVVTHVGVKGNGDLRILDTDHGVIELHADECVNGVPTIRSHPFSRIVSPNSTYLKARGLGGARHFERFGYVERAGGLIQVENSARQGAGEERSMADELHENVMW